MNLSAHPFLVHPHTKEPLKPVGFRKPRLGEIGLQPIWPCIGASEDDDAGAGGGAGDGGAGDKGGAGAGDQGDAGKSGASDDKGFPANTPVADMTIEQQLAYWTHYARKHEERAKPWAALGKDVTPEKVRELMDGQKTTEEKALEAAKAEGRSAALVELNQSLVDDVIADRLKAAGKKAEDVPMLDVVDFTKCTNEDGRLVMSKVNAVLDTILPAADGGGGARRWPDMGQGNRGDQPKPGKAAAGKAEAEKRFKQSK